MRSLTVDDIMGFSPCSDYTRSRIEELGAGRSSITPLEILDIDIPPHDRYWLLTRPGVLPDAVLHEVACRVAEKLLDDREAAGRKVDPRSRAAIVGKRAWLRGEIGDAELTAIRRAADAYAADADAADAAAYAAAYAAADADAYAAADADAAYAAYAAAAYAAADADAAYAAYAAAYAARRLTYQFALDQIRELITGD